MKVWLRTFGCRANQYDSEAVRALLDANGHDVASSAADADVAIFNSCAVTADAVADLRQSVRRAAREQPGLRSLVMGCASALPDRTELARLPGVTHLIEGADLDGLAKALDFDVMPAAVRTMSQSGARALLRVQDGCDEHCTFCATTIARGANRSRPVAELVDEARALSARHAEIVITGVHIGTYGLDLGTTLGALMAQLIASVPESRFRLTSIEVSEIDPELLDLMASAPRHLVPQVHAPLQSGSNRVLKRMGRHWYTRESYAATAERMAERLPVFGLGADIITGFPGETEQDHEQTVSLVEQLPFTYLHVFPYSERPGTAAVKLPDQVPADIARRRAAELRAIGSIKAEAHAASRSGQRADVVVIGAGERRRGLTEDYLEVDLVGGTPARGVRVDVLLERNGDALTGRI